MRPLNEDILTLSSSITMPLLRLPCTSTAIRTSRGVVLISPGKKISEQADTVAEFGRVTDIVAPNLLHHVSLHLAQRAFPDATVWGVHGFKEKRPDVAWDKFLDDQTWTYADEIKVFPIRGISKINECAFLHLSSKTLVVTDLFFNLLRARGFGAWLILKIFGTYRRFGISKFFLRFCNDKKAFINSLQEIAASDFTSIVMAHGDPVTENAKQLVMTALKERDLL